MSMSALKKAGPALVIFTVAVVARAVLEAIPHAGSADYSWITTFAAIAASWVGITSGLSEIKERQEAQRSTLDTVQRNTNGKSDAERQAIALEAATAALAALESKPRSKPINGATEAQEGVQAH